MLFVIGPRLIARRVGLPPGAGMVAFPAVVVAVDWMLIRQLSRVVEHVPRERDTRPQAR